VTRYLDLAEFFWLAEQVTGLDTTTLVKASRVELADSALHAPQAGYGDDDFYPTCTTRPPYSRAALRGIIPCPMATSARRGRACCCSSISTVDLGIRTHPTSKMLSRACSMSRHATSTRSRSRVGSASGFDSLSSGPAPEHRFGLPRVRAAAQMTAVAEISTRRPAFQSAETPTRVRAVGIGGLPVSAARSPLPR
jgi:hypothetical protein